MQACYTKLYGGCTNVKAHVCGFRVQLVIYVTLVINEVQKRFFFWNGWSIGVLPLLFLVAPLYVTLVINEVQKRFFFLNGWSIGVLPLLFLVAPLQI